MDKNAKAQTDPLLLAYTPPLALWNADEIRKHQHIWFQQTSGPGPDDFEDVEDLAEKDTAEVSVPIDLYLISHSTEFQSRFVGISQSALSLFRSAVQNHRDEHGTLPESLQASPERCKSFKNEMEYIYGKDFQGRLPILLDHDDKFVRITPNDTLDRFTVICVHSTHH